MRWFQKPRREGLQTSLIKTGILAKEPTCQIETLLLGKGHEKKEYRDVWRNVQFSKGVGL